MFRKTFHTALRSGRTRKGISQRRLASMAGIGAYRLCRLEYARVAPSRQERKSLAEILTDNAFEILYSSARVPRFQQTLSVRGKSVPESPKPYLPVPDRRPSIRLASAMRSYPDLMQELVAKVKARPDFEVVNDFCEMLSIGSCAECLYICLLLVTGAKPALLAPHTLPPHIPREIVCPRDKSGVGFRPHPCLLTSAGITFPQVSFKTPRIFTVDFLQQRNGHWEVLEIDGNGHRSKKDKERSKALGLPVIRLSEKDLLHLVRERLTAAA